MWLDKRSHEHTSNGLKQIYFSEGDIDEHAVNFLAEIELEDNLKSYASVWEVDDEDKIICTKDGKVMISKEPLLTLLRLPGNQLD